MEIDHSSPEYIGEILDKVATKVPKLIGDIIGTFYSPEAGQNMGKAIGALYKELVDSGIPQEDALKMAKDYMLSIAQIKEFVNK